MGFGSWILGLLSPIISQIIVYLENTNFKKRFSLGYLIQNVELQQELHVQDKEIMGGIRIGQCLISHIHLTDLLLTMNRIFFKRQIQHDVVINSKTVSNSLKSKRKLTLRGGGSNYK
ncbi:hypothetical protein CR513_62690, partial [Mucuna pruriens]